MEGFYVYIYIFIQYSRSTNSFENLYISQTYPFSSCQTLFFLDFLQIILESLEIVYRWILDIGSILALKGAALAQCFDL